MYAQVLHILEDKLNYIVVDCDNSSISSESEDYVTTRVILSFTHQNATNERH